MEDPEMTLTPGVVTALCATEYAPGLTVMEAEVALRAPLDAVTVFEPAVFKVNENVPTPEERSEAVGRAADESLDEIATEPLNPVAVFPYESLAVTTTEEAAPATKLEERPERRS